MDFEDYVVWSTCSMTKSTNSVSPMQMLQGPSLRRKSSKSSQESYQYSIEQEIQKIRDQVDRTLNSRVSCSINPHAGWHTAWDLFMVLLVCFVAISLPVELAYFRGNDDLPYAYWVWNRIVDAMFWIDLVMNFFVGIEDEVDGSIERDVKIIAKQYARSWFIIDLVSVIPFFLLDEEIGNWLMPTSEFDLNQQVQVLQLVRIIRVVKVVRLLRASRILKRWVCSNIFTLWYGLWYCLAAQRAKMIRYVVYV